VLAASFFGINWQKDQLITSTLAPETTQTQHAGVREDSNGGGR
jgi:hypothetical protein